MSNNEKQEENEEEDVDISEWERTNIQSIQEAKEAEIGSKKYLLMKESSDFTLQLAKKEKELQKYVRGVTEETGKLRLEVGWLEKDLSQIKETARRQILEVRTALQCQKLKIEDEINEKEKEIRELRKKIESQRDQFTQQILTAKAIKTNAINDLNLTIQKLSNEIQNITNSFGKVGVKHETSTVDVKKTNELLENEINNIESRSKSLDKSVNKERDRCEFLTQKLKKAEEKTEQLNQLIQKEKDQRVHLREELNKNDQSKWMERIHSLSNMNLEMDLTADIDI